MQVKVEILCTTITQQYGALKQGDILTTNQVFAKHLVEDCKAAKYCVPQADAEEASQKQAKSKPKASQTLLEKAKNLLKI